ncbi:SHOCT domain-containing protein [Streptomyces sp. NPDC050504]|uniref:SHOCT domain-containing protein n=1 Tax=Streptomyces sp. NPDC050504 TaxID=3365618 RepID=UPI003795BD31
MNTLAHAGGSGPGPWILLFPLVWAAVVATAATVLRRIVRRGRAPWQQHAGRAAHGERSPIGLLGRRFAAGEIEEEEYWSRLSVLDEQFGTAGTKGGAA